MLIKFAASLIKDETSNTGSSEYPGKSISSFS